MRYLPFLVLLLALDFLLLPQVQFWVSDCSSNTQAVVQVIHFLVPLSFVGLLAANNQWQLRKRNRTRFTSVYSTFQLIYICKFIALLGLLLCVFVDLGLSLFSLLDLDVPLIRDSRFPIALVLALIPFFLLPYGILVNRHRYQIREVNVSIEDLPSSLEGLKIVQISDLHAGSFFDPSGFEKGVAMINELEPDLIFFTGDLVNNRAIEFERFIDTFKKMKAKYGVYSVLGNHDYGDYIQWKSKEAKRQNIARLIDIQKSMGWKVLLNEHEVVEVNGSKVAVVGVQNYSAKLRFPKYGDLEKASQGSDDADIHLLLSHDPSHWAYQVVPEFKNIDITFSGHTHGMQFGIEIGKWKWSPIQYIYKEWAGLYKQGRQYLYVNRGFGVLGYPGRVGILPEITAMTISKAN